VAVSPLGVSVESLASSLGDTVRRVTWTVPVPSQLCPGLDPWACLPPLPSQASLDVDAAQEASDNAEAAAEEAEAEEADGVYPAAPVEGPSEAAGENRAEGLLAPAADSAAARLGPWRGRLYDPAVHGPKWTCGYAVRPARTLAVTPFGLADTATDEAALARRKLLSDMARDGLQPTASAASGKPKFELLQHSTKLGWSPKTK